MREIRKEALPGCSQVDGLLPYTGVGSGFIRVRELDEKIEVLNDEKRKEVIVTFWRESNQESVRVTDESDRGNGESVRPGVRAMDALTGKEVDIVNFCTVPRTSKEILARVGVSYHSKNLAKYVNSLVNKGFLKMTIPETPNDPNQKYVKA